MIRTCGSKLEMKEVDIMNKFREARVDFLKEHPLDAETVESMLHALEMFFATGRFLHSRSTVEAATKSVARVLGFSKDKEEEHE